MKIFLILIILANISYMQSLPDSLKFLWNEDERNEAWVETINHNLKNYLLKNPIEARGYLENVKRIADSIDYAKGRNQAEYLLAETYGIEGNYSKQMNILKKLLNSRESPLDNETKSIIYISLGETYREIGEYDSALTNFREAEKNSDAGYLSRRTAQIANSKGNIFSLRGEYKTAVESYLEAAKIYEKLDVRDELAVVYNNLASERANLEQYDKSNEYYKKAIKLNKQFDNLHDLSMNYANLGVNYKEIGKLDTALYYYNKSLKMAEELNSSIRLAQNYLNIANIHKQKEEYSRALQYLNKSLGICKDKDIKFGLVLNYINIGDLYQLQNNHERALVNYDKAFELTEMMNLPNEKAHVYENYYLIYKERGDYKKALEYQTKFHLIRDSLMNKEKQRQILELQTKYETAKKEKENELLKKQKKIQQATIQNEVTKNRAYSIIAVLAILLLSGVVGLYFYRHKTSKRISRQNAELEKLNNELNEKNESLEEMNETKDKLFSIISHDLKNQFSIIMSYSEMLSEDINELNQEEIQNFTGGIYESSESVLKSLENMLNWARSQLNKISVNPIPFSLNEVINEVSMIYSKFAESKRIELTVNTPEELYAYADKNMIDSVIKNLVSNACKFTEPETGRVSIKAVRSYNFCRVTIEDNGVGMDQNTINNLFKLKQNATERGTKNEKGTGLGLILTKEFIEKNGGELTVKSELNEGSAFTFTVPLNTDPLS